MMPYTQFDPSSIMDPILATGLVSIGKNLVERIMPDQNTSNTSVSFDQVLQKNAQAATPIQINQLEAKLRTETSALYNSPQFQKICQQFQNADSLQLERLEDGSIALSSGPNDTLKVPSDSELGMKLGNILEMKENLQNLKGISKTTNIYSLQNPYEIANFY